MQQPAMDISAYMQQPAMKGRKQCISLIYDTYLVSIYLYMHAAAINEFMSTVHLTSISHM